MLHLPLAFPNATLPAFPYIFHHFPEPHRFAPCTFSPTPDLTGHSFHTLPCGGIRPTHGAVVAYTTHHTCHAFPGGCPCHANRHMCCGRPSTPTPPPQLMDRVGPRQTSTPMGILPTLHCVPLGTTVGHFISFMGCTFLRCAHTYYPQFIYCAIFILMIICSRWEQTFFLLILCPSDHLLFRLGWCPSPDLLWNGCD